MIVEVLLDEEERVDGEDPTGAGAPVDFGAALVTAIGDFAPVWFRWLRATVSVEEATWSRIRLLNLLHDAGPRTMGQLAEAMDVTPRNVTALVDALEAAAHVRRTEDTADRRVKWISLTETGERHCAEFLPQWMSEIAVAFDGIDVTDRQDFLRILTALTAHLSHREPPS